MDMVLLQEKPKQEVTWKPQAGPQTAALHCQWADEVMFGGARGGGKTDCALGRLLIKCLVVGNGVRGIFFRRTYKQLEEVIGRAKELFEPHGFVWKEKTATLSHSNGAWVRMRYLDNDSDADHYQGHSYTDIVVEEAGTFPSWAPIAKLKGTLRSAKGIKCQLFLTSNPGGVGSHWVRSRYIEPAPAGWRPIKEVAERVLANGQKVTAESTRIYIPSRLTDNQILMQSDPGYVARLMEAGDEALVRAWLDGDFFVTPGAFFDCFNQKKHVIPPFAIPDWWTKFRSGDWGSAKPFAFHWMAVAAEAWKHPVTGQIVPKGAIVVYREWYGVKTKQDGTIQANVGLKMFAEPVGRGILDRDGHDRINYGVLDPSAFIVDGGPSIAERIYRGSGGKVLFRRADNKRVATVGAISGWDQVRARLIGEEKEDGSGETVPMVYFFTNCHHLIRTLPMMQHDPDNPEDMQTDGEDHAVDSLRYGLMSRPYSAPTPTKRKPMTSLRDVTLSRLWEDAEQQRSLTDDRI